MAENIKQKYNLFAAFCMVVGVVIGSGIFFKAPKLFAEAEGNLLGALISVGAVGVIVLIVALTFATLGEIYPIGDGLVGVAEVAIGPRYAYMVGWFVSTIFYPTLTAALARISGTYITELLGVKEAGAELLISGGVLIFAFALNTLAPKKATALGVATTSIKLVPLIVLGVVGSIIGLVSGNFANAFSGEGAPSISGGGIIGGIVAFAFAYEGWIAVSAVAKEIKNARKNLPLALVFGLILVIGVYLAYILGIGGVLSREEILASGNNLSLTAFTTLLFGNATLGRFFYLFVAISCVGTTVGLSLAASRGIFALAERGRGPSAELFSHIDSTSAVPVNSSLFALVVSTVWLFQWEFGFVWGLLPEWLSFEHDELPIITLYFALVPIFLTLPFRGKKLPITKRFILPILAVLSALFMLYCAATAYGIQILYYLLVFLIIMLIGLFFYRPKVEG